MKPSSSSGFAHQVLVMSLVAIGCTGAAGLSAVWTRRQISVVANADQALEARIAAVERSCDATAAEIAAEEAPAVLQRVDAAWRLGLAPPQPDQIERIAGNPEAALMAKGNRGLFGDRPEPPRFRVAAQP